MEAIWRVGVPHCGVPHSSLVWKMLHFCEFLLFSAIFDHFGRFLAYFGVFRCNLVVFWCKKNVALAKKMGEQPFFPLLGYKNDHFGGFLGVGGAILGSTESRFRENWGKIGAGSKWAPNGLQNGIFLALGPNVNHYCVREPLCGQILWHV